MANANETLRELLRVSAELESPESKGSRTALKAYQRKLYRQYTAQVSAQ